MWLFLTSPELYASLYFNDKFLKNISLFIPIVFLLQACSLKTVTHPYPRPFEGIGNKFSDILIVEWKGSDYTYRSGAEVSEDLPFPYKDEALHIMQGWDAEWKLKSSYINPLNDQEFTISSSAGFDRDLRKELIIVKMYPGSSETTPLNVLRSEPSLTLISTESGEFEITEVAYWDSDIVKRKESGETVWHHYPYGRLLELRHYDQKVAEIVQGSPVVKKLGKEINYGKSFTMMFYESLPERDKAIYLDIMIGYLALEKISTYYEECDPDDAAQSEYCPGSIIVR